MRAQLQALADLPQGKAPLLIEQYAGLTPEPIRTPNYTTTNFSVKLLHLSWFQIFSYLSDTCNLSWMCVLWTMRHIITIISNVTPQHTNAFYCHHITYVNNTTQMNRLMQDKILLLCWPEFRRKYWLYWFRFPEVFPSPSGNNTSTGPRPLTCKSFPINASAIILPPTLSTPRY